MERGAERAPLIFKGDEGKGYFQPYLPALLFKLAPLSARAVFSASSTMTNHLVSHV